jgi:CRISPR-associated exonuclease Cas4
LIAPAFPLGINMDQEMIDNLIDSYIKRPEKERKVGTYYPSEIGYCIRRVYLQYKFPKEIDKSVLRIFAVGNIFHEFIAKVLSSAGFETHLNERSVCLIDSFDKFILSGRLDDFVVAVKNGKSYVIDVKSTNSISKTKEPSEFHKIQIAPYIKAIGADGGFILYVEKNNLQTKLFKVDNWEKYLDIALARGHKLHKALTTNALPFREAKKFNAWQCDYCQYQKECEELGEGTEIK